MKSINDQIVDLENTRAAKAGEMKALTDKATEEGRSMEADEAERFDELDTEIKTVDSDLGRFRRMAELSKAATPVSNKPTTTAATESRAPLSVKNTQKLEPGIAFARFARCVVLSRLAQVPVDQVVQSEYPDMENLVGVAKAMTKFGASGLVEKAAVAAGNTTDTTWAAPLVQYQQYAGDFLEYLRPRTILGRFGTDGIPGLRRVPFNVTISGQTSGGNANWVGEGAPKPLTKFDFANVNLRWAKIAAISVITEELARMSTPSAEALVRDSLAAAVIERMDKDFVDPDKAAVANVSPASITNGVAPINSSGTDAEGIRTDFRNLMANYIANNVDPAGAVLMMTPGTALALSLMQNPLGQSEFPGINMTGGRLFGLPVIVSQYLINDGGSAGGIIVMANANEIYLADDGQVSIDVSREASLQMNDAPDNPATASTVFVSMYQTNQIAIRAERYVNWAKRRASAVSWLDSVSWGT